MRECSPLDSLSEILMDVPDLVFVYAIDGRYLFINDSAAAFLDTDPLEVIGRDWRDLGYPPDVMTPIFEQVAVVASTCEPVRLRLRGSAERGGRVFDLSMTPLRCEGGDILGVLAIAHDITEFF